MKLHADVRALKRAPPPWAKWLCISANGVAWWSTLRGIGRLWISHGKSKLAAYDGLKEIAGSAICLTTGSVHLQSDDGEITVVPQSVWVAARKRKGACAMSNMSYCRFENTLADLRDCNDALAEHCDPLAELSESERKAAIKLFVLCGQIASDYESEIELDIDRRQNRAMLAAREAKA